MPDIANSSVSSGFIKRLGDLCEGLGGKDRTAEQAGIARRTLGNYLSGRNEPKMSALIALAKLAGVSLDWLLTGEGPMRRSEPASAPALPDHVLHIALVRFLDLTQGLAAPLRTPEILLSVWRVALKEAQTGTMAAAAIDAAEGLDAIADAKKESADKNKR